MPASQTAAIFTTASPPRLPSRDPQPQCRYGGTPPQFSLTLPRIRPFYGLFAVRYLTQLKPHQMRLWRPELEAAA